MFRRIISKFVDVRDKEKLMKIRAGLATAYAFLMWNAVFFVFYKSHKRDVERSNLSETEYFHSHLSNAKHITFYRINGFSGIEKLNIVNEEKEDQKIQTDSVEEII